MPNTEERIRQAVSQLAATTPIGQIRLCQVATLAELSAPTVRKYVRGKAGLRHFMAKHNIVGSHAAEETPEKILDAARRIFAQRGYDGATMDEIAAAANMTKGAVYHYFDNKRELFWILSERRLNQQISLANSAVVPAGQSASEGLELLFSTVMESLVADPGWTRLHFEILSRTRDAETAELFRRTDSYLTNRIAADIAAAQAAGTFRQGVEPEAMAFVIVAIIARLSQYAVLGDTEETAAELLPGIAKILVQGDD